MLSHHSLATGGDRTSSSLKSDCTQMISAVALAIALYFAFVLDRETVDYLRALQETRLLPKNMENPPVDILSSMFPAQSASENPLTRADRDLVIFSPKLVVCFMYLKICLTVVQCTEVGA
jgi:hypothetical protein